MNRYIYSGIALLMAIAVFLTSKSCYDRGVVEQAALAASQKHLLEQADSLRGELKLSNEQIAHDTVVRNRTLISYRSLRDTLVITDTVQVKVALARADTVIQKDSAAIRSLVLGIHVRDATIFNRDSTIKVLNARFPTSKQRIITDIKWLLIGAAADELYHAVRSKRP